LTKKIGWATLWVIFPQTHPVNLLGSEEFSFISQPSAKDIKNLFIGAPLLFGMQTYQR
jgi:hypothetical protein